MINEKTDLYISASARPGHFGATVFNHLFKVFDLNAVYIPRKFDSAKDLTESIRMMSILGCGVSNPLKISVINYLNHLDEAAERLQSVNTIKNVNGQLLGFNTDWLGAQLALQRHLVNSEAQISSARIIGSGGVAPALVLAMQNLGISDIEIVYRNQNSADSLKKKWNVNVCALRDIENLSEKDLLISAISTVERENDLIFEQLISKSKIIFDLVVKPSSTSLIQMAQVENKKFINGYEMAIFQLIEQYFIYFNKKLNFSDVFEIVQNYYLEKKD